MRIRKKLIVLHTCFSVGLAVILLILLRPALAEVVEQAEMEEARMLLRMVIAGGGVDAAAFGDGPEQDVIVRSGSAEELSLPEALEEQARQQPGEPIEVGWIDGRAGAAAYVAGPDGEEGRWFLVLARIAESRAAVVRLYVIVTLALLVVYALVAAALELFVLPQHVYGPIGRMLHADRAVQEGARAEELIPEAEIPADELGEIMRSRNRSIEAMRRHERALAEALAQLEEVATDLARKNHLLENARRNLVESDRLASLGMMSAGIAHELNTPLAVLKGLVEKLNQDPGRGMEPAQSALMLRVVRRLERLGDSLLDFARARPSRSSPALLRPLVEEAITLVRLDREARDVSLVNDVPGDLVVECDADRMMQVLVNLLRNGIDAVQSRAGMDAGGARVVVRAAALERDRAQWVCITITDDGPGIDPDLLPRLFQPFVSTRLDARGTGLGLAVAEGIVREHGGLVLARNRTDGTGAVFEVMLPARGEGGGIQ
jgi:signal transduction histidine kinase